MKAVFLLTSVLFFISFAVDAFVQTNFDMSILTSAASPDALFFWQNEKDDSTTGIVKILSVDMVVWKNVDTATHTVMSGTVTAETDALFDSGLFGPGKSFPYTFTETCDYPYYCIVHPCMEDTVIATAGYYIISYVGKQVGDGFAFFDVEYDFNCVLSIAMINEEQKSITFEIIGNAESDNMV